MDNIYPFAWYIVFVLSVTLHEAAHAWAAKRGGDLTAYAGGQVSLNPIPHMKREPFGMVVIPLVSAFLIGWPFGYASTPYDPLWAYRNPRKAGWMAAAGPGANLFLVLVCFAVIKIGITGGIFLVPDSIGFMHMVDPVSQGHMAGVVLFISMMFTLNLILLVLNMLPLPPFDGSSVLSLFLQDEAARKYRTVITNPMFGFIGFFLAWKLFTPLFDIVFLKIINIIYWPAVYG